MISAQYYPIIYQITVTIATLTVIYQYQSDKRFNLSPRGDSSKGWWLAIFFALFIGFRPVDIQFVDMVGYAGMYDWLTTSAGSYNWESENRIFDNLLLYMAQNGYTKDIFFFLITSIYFIVSYIAIKRIFKDNPLAAYIVWLGAFSTFSYSVNGIKAGAAAAFFLLALSYYDRKIISILIALVSLGFHHSMSVCLTAYIIIMIVKDTRYYFFFWIICLLIAAMKITYFQELFGSLTDDRSSSYLLTTSGDHFGGKGGFRYDFILYSSVPIIIGFIAVFKRHLKSRQFSVLYNFYLLTNGIWMLCMYASFTNRIAYLSWFVYPLVLVYPLLDMKWGSDRSVTFRYITFANLAFTLFMSNIYY